MAYGAIEAGGTKFVCAIGTSPADVLARRRIDTGEPGPTLDGVVDFFEAGPPVEAVGIASFGPVELRPGHPRYGHITTTPKPGWSGADLVGTVGGALGVPVGFDTDVNGAALGEGRWGAAQGRGTFVYVTLGTGVGGGMVVDGRPVHGLVHPEMGHVAVARRAGDGFPGVCPFHGNCLEGMASGPAVTARWGRPAADLAGDDLAAAVEIEAYYVASGLRNVVYVGAPELIVIGGGLSAMPGLVGAVGRELAAALGGYPGLPEHEGFVVPAGLGADAGLAGAFVLAERARS